MNDVSELMRKFCDTLNSDDLDEIVRLQREHQKQLAMGIRRAPAEDRTPLSEIMGKTVSFNKPKLNIDLGF